MQFRSAYILHCVSLGAGALLVIGGGLAAIGWIADIPWLKGSSPGLVMMEVNTAAGFILSGVSLWCLRYERPGRGIQLAGRVCAAIVAVAALLTLGEHILGADFGIDQALIDQSSAVSVSARPGRMSIATAFSFLLIGAALLGLDWKNGRGRRPALALALVTATIALLVMAGYLYEAKSLYASSPVTATSLPAAVLFFTASLGILCMRPDRGPLGVLVATGVGSTMARRIIPLAIFLPFLLGWLRLLGERAGFYGLEFGLVLFATSNVVVFTALVWVTANSLNRGDIGRVNAEEELRRSEASLANAQRIANMGSWDWDVQADRLHWSEHIFRMFGIEKKDFGANYEAFMGRVHPQDRARVDTALQDALEGGPDFDIQHRILLPDGSVKVLHILGDLSRDAESRPLRLSGTALDITERVLAEQALQRSEEQYRQMVNLSPDAVTIHQDGIWVFANAAAAKLLGVEKPAQLVGRSLLDFMHPSVHEQVRARWKQLYEARQAVEPAELQMTRPDGSVVLLETQAAPLIWEGRQAAQVVARDVTQRKRAEEALRASEAQLRSFIEQAPASMAMFDTDMICLAASRRWVADYGRGRHNLVGLSHYEVHPDLPQEWLEIHRKGLNGEAQGRDEDLWVQADGTSNWLRWAVQPWRDVHGDIGGIMILAEDITRRKQIEQEISETKNFLASIFDNIPSSIFVKDARELRFVRVNAANGRLTGYPAEELLGKTDYDLFPKKQADFFVAKDRETLASNQRIFIVEEEITSKDGTTRILRTKKFPIVDGHGQPQYLLGMSEDITEQKHAEKQLRESEEKFRQLIEQASDGIFVSDTEGRFLLVNSAGCKLLGYSEAELLGLTIEMTYLEEERPLHRERMQRVRSGAAMRFERIASRKDGSTFPTAVSLTQLKNGNVQGFFSDITERRAQEQKIARLSRIQAVLSGINSAIVRIRDRHELFREACRIILEHGGFNLGWIGILDKTTGKLIAVAQAGLPEETASAVFNGSIGLVPAGAAAVTIRERRSATDNVIEDAPGAIPAGHAPDSLRVRLAAIELGAKSVISLPLVVEGEMFGILTVYAPDRNFFDDEEVKLLDELAADVSFGLTFIAKEEKVDYLAYYDTLTGLPNRTLFFDRLGRQLATAERERRKVALVLLDIDRFRMVNDTLGRQAGDILLQAISQRIKDSVRDEDTVARTGADGFAIAFATDQDVAHLVEARSRSLFGKSFTIDGEDLRISVTAGAAVYPNDAANQEDLVANAEAALRSAKQQNVPLLFYGPEMNAQAAESLRLENRLRRALENKELVLWYQPKMDLKTGKITGMEALMRWQDPEAGLVPPMQFIPVMEQTGMILEAGNWALAQVAVECRRWVKEGLKPPRIAVNVSPIQLRQKEFVSTVIEAAQATEEAGGALDLEITESVIMENVDAIIPKLQTIRGLGVEIYIDDFGTGYSSLAYIARLPIHALKIDRSFVVGMTQSEESLNIVNSVISLAHSLKLRVVAEGVETDAQATLLGQLKCDEFQGYLTSKPVPPEEVPALLRRLV